MLLTLSGEWLAKAKNLALSLSHIADGGTNVHMATDATRGANDLLTIVLSTFHGNCRKGQTGADLALGQHLNEVASILFEKTGPPPLPLIPAITEEHNGQQQLNVELAAAALAGLPQERLRLVIDSSAAKSLLAGCRNVLEDLVRLADAIPPASLTEADGPAIEGVRQLIHYFPPRGGAVTGRENLFHPTAPNPLFTGGPRAAAASLASRGPLPPISRQPGNNGSGTVGRLSEPPGERATIQQLLAGGGAGALRAATTMNGEPPPFVFPPFSLSEGGAWVGGGMYSAALLYQYVNKENLNIIKASIPGFSLLSAENLANLTADQLLHLRLYLPGSEMSAFMDHGGNVGTSSSKLPPLPALKDLNNLAQAITNRAAVIQSLIPAELQQQVGAAVARYHINLLQGLQTGVIESIDALVRVDARTWTTMARHHATGPDSALDMNAVAQSNKEAKEAAKLPAGSVLHRLSYEKDDTRDPANSSGRLGRPRPDEICSYFQTKGTCGVLCGKLHLCLACCGNGSVGQHNPAGYSSVCKTIHGARKEGVTSAGFKRHRDAREDKDRGSKGWSGSKQREKRKKEDTS